MKNSAKSKRKLNELEFVSIEPKIKETFSSTTDEERYARY